MSDDFMVVPPDRLFTWVDIDEHLRSLAVRGLWPGWLREVSAYWDGVEITVAVGTGTDEIWAWLRSVLGRRVVDAEREVVLLEHPADERVLPIVFDTVSAEDAEPTRRLPEWSETLLTSDLGRPLPAPAEHRFADGVTIGAFHSFKGGVGRTLHCVALAHLIASRSRERVLLIDADMEAPGVSWMMRPQGTRGEFSFADFMALVHGSVEGDSAEAVAIARPHLVNQEMDRIFILPAQRDPERFGPPRIEPRHLLSPGRSPYVLTESLAELAGALEARTVLIDLRAGMSETSAPVLLDPRVKRVFVTTVSDQSVRGTVRVLNELALRAPSMRETDPVPTALITQFRDHDHDDLVESISDRLGDAIARITSFGEDDNSTVTASGELSRTLTSAPMRSPFNPSLLALPAAWDRVREELDRADTLGVLHELADELTPEYRASDDTRISEYDAQIVQRDRGRLAAFAGRPHPGDGREVDGTPFSPPGLVSLAAAHRSELPLEVVTGTAGAGKTSAYLGLCRSGGWRKFALQLGVRGVVHDAPIVPVLAPRDADSNTRSSGTASADASRERSDLTRAEANMRTLAAALGHDRTDAEWRQIWFTCFARAAGLTSFPNMAEEVLAGLAGKGRTVFAVDGLDELFYDLHRNERQQRALRVLLVDCRNWFHALHGRPLGLVVFLRRDLVQYALADADRFLSRHRRYAMVWDRESALRFTAWTVSTAKALPRPKGGDVRSAPESELSNYLVDLWGEQLGAPGSKEARSQEWFLAALADFTNQIQPGDILRFLAEAARLSAAEPGDWTRLLTPSAMRAALPVCSRARVDAISRRIPAIGAVLAKLAELDQDRRSVPFDPETVALTTDEIELLTANGIIAQVKGEYWMPEIYRSALGFTARRRSPLLSIAKEARRRFPDL